MELTYHRTAMGRYEVYSGGEVVGRVCTARRNNHWRWIVIDGRRSSAAHARTFRSREAAAQALRVA